MERVPLKQKVLSENQLLAEGGQAVHLDGGLENDDQQRHGHDAQAEQQVAIERCREPAAHPPILEQGLRIGGPTCD